MTVVPALDRTAPLGATSVPLPRAPHRSLLARVRRLLGRSDASYREDVLLTGVGQLAAAAGRIIFITLVARAVGSRGLADATTVIALGTLLSLVTAAGIGPASTRRIASARARNQPNAVTATFYRTRRVAYVSLLASGSLGGCMYAFVFGELWVGVNLIGFVLAYGLYQYYWAVYYGLGRVSRYVRSEVRADLLIVLAAPIAVLSRPLLILPFYVGYASFILAAERDVARAFAQICTGSQPTLHTPDREDNELWRYALISTVGTAASMATLQLGVVVSHQALGSLLAGSYAAAYSLILPLMYLPRTLATALLPRAAADVARDRREAIRTRLSVLTDVLALIAVPLCLLGIVLADPLLKLLVGGRYSDGAPPLRILLVATFFLMVSVPAVNILSAGTVRSLATPFYASVAGFIVGAAVWTISLGTGGGLVAIAIGVLAGSVTKSVPPVIIAFRRCGASLSHLTLAALVLIIGAAMGIQHGPVLVAAVAFSVTVAGCATALLVPLWKRTSQTR